MKRAAIISLTALGLLGIASAGLAVTPKPPDVSTRGAGSVGTSSARLNGTVNPNGQSTSWYFEFGTSTGYGTRTATRNAGAGTRGVDVQMTISGLAVATTYHYRLVGVNEQGTSFGQDVVLTTADR